MHHNSAASAEEQAAVRAAYQRLMDGWNQGSGTAYAAAFTEDGDLVGFDGEHFKGRAEIARFTRSSSTSGSKGAGSWERSRVCGS